MNEETMIEWLKLYPEDYDMYLNILEEAQTQDVLELSAINMGM